eukprot:13478899-Heterocapsa_arctica.AAC.1
MVLCPARVAGWYCVLTPDSEVYMEQRSTANQDLLGVQFLLAAGAGAIDVARERVHRFRAVP